MVWPGIIGQIALFGAWASTGLAGGISRTTALMQSSTSLLTDLSSNVQVYLLNLIRQGATGITGGTGGSGGTGLPGGIQPVYAAPIGGGGGGTGLPPVGGQPVYAAPIGGGTGGFPPVGGQPVYAAPIGGGGSGTGLPPVGGQPVYAAPIGGGTGGVPPGGNPQPVYAAPIGTDSSGGHGTPFDFVSVRLTDMINLHHVSPEALISLAVYAVWILITFWALIGWVFWGLVLYLKKREAFKMQKE